MLDTREKELVKASASRPLLAAFNDPGAGAVLSPTVRTPQMIEEAEEAEKVRVLDKRVERISACCESLTVSRTKARLGDPAGLW